MTGATPNQDAMTPGHNRLGLRRVTCKRELAEHGDEPARRDTEEPRHTPKSQGKTFSLPCAD